MLSLNPWQDNFEFKSTTHTKSKPNDLPCVWLKSNSNSISDLEFQQSKVVTSKYG